MVEDQRRVTFYLAVASDGQEVSGEIGLRSHQEAMVELHRRGLIPLRLSDRPITRSPLQREISFGRRHLGSNTCHRFCGDLALALGSGLSTAEAISIIAPQSRRRSKYSDFVAVLQENIRKGKSLSRAIEASGLAIPEDLVPVIRAGEQSGDLPSALTNLADAYARREKFRRALMSALLYPAFLLLVSLGAFGIIAFFVAPSLNELFVSMNKTPPAVIAIMVTSSGWLISNILGFVACALAAVAVLAALAGTPAVRERAREVLRGLPLIGGAIAWSATGKLTSVLHICLRTRVPIAIAMPIAIRAAGITSRSRLDAVVSDLRRGATISDAISSNRLLPEKALELLRVGERSNRLLNILATLTEEAETRMNSRLTLVSSLLSPILIVCVGAVAGTIIYSVFSALLDLNQLAQ